MNDSRTCERGALKSENHHLPAETSRQITSPSQIPVPLQKSGMMLIPAPQQGIEIPDRTWNAKVMLSNECWFVFLV